MDKKALHIGKLIKSKMKEEGRVAKWLADKIGCEVSVIYRIYKRQLPDTERLFKICTVLKINVYPLYVDHVNELIQKGNNQV
jgi:ribosome-binding protein aMBF1 (putative translation factor)